MLEVEFRDGSSYVYYMVPRPIFEGLVEAESAGSYLVEQIRGRFRDERRGSKG